MEFKITGCSANDGENNTTTDNNLSSSVSIKAEKLKKKKPSSNYKRDAVLLLERNEFDTALEIIGKGIALNLLEDPLLYDSKAKILLGNEYDNALFKREDQIYDHLINGKEDHTSNSFICFSRVLFYKKYNFVINAFYGSSLIILEHLIKNQINIKNLPKKFDKIIKIKN